MATGIGALTVSQMISASYNNVLNEARKPENQWAENAFLRELERQGAIKKVDGAPVYEFALDFNVNPGAGFQATDLAAMSTSKTDILTSATCVSAQLGVPLVWSKKDEAENASASQKVSLVKSLMENAINSHDDKLERAIFSTTTNGFTGLQNLVPTTGQGNVEGIDAATETAWRNGADTAGSSTILAKMNLMWNTLSKGSGSALAPKFIVSDGATQAIYEGTQTGLVRYVDTREADAGFKILAFKTARYVFSQFGSAKIYFLNPKSYQVIVVKQAFRSLGDTQEFTDAQGYIRKMFTLAQAVTNNKSRLGVISYS